MTAGPLIRAGTTAVCMMWIASGLNAGDRSLIDQVTDSALREQLSQNEEALALARSEADYFHQQWMELKLKVEALGIDALTGNEKALQERMVRLVGELYRSELRNRQLEEVLDDLIESGKRLQQAGILERAQRRAEYEAQVRRARSIIDGEAAQSIKIARDLNSGTVTIFDPELSVAIVNLGKAQDAREGMPFRILRENRVIGRCRLIEVREYLSAALVEGVIPDETINPGDRLLPDANK